MATLIVIYFFSRFAAGASSSSSSSSHKSTTSAGVGGIPSFPAAAASALARLSAASATSARISLDPRISGAAATRRDGDDRRRRATQRRRERVDPAQPAPLPHERAAARRRRDVRDAPRGGQHRARPLSYVLEPSLPQVRAAVHPRHDHGVPDRSSRVELRADRRAAARLAVVVEPAVDLRRRRSLALLRGGSRFRRRRRRRDRRGTPPRAHGVIGVLHRDVSLHVRDGRARDRSGEARVREVRDEDAAAVHDRRAVEDRQRAGATGQRGRLAAVHVWVRHQME